MSLLKRKLWLIFIVLARILITVEGVVLNGTDICPSVNAVLLDDLRQLRDCKVVDGSVRLAFLDFARVSAEEYTTNIEEINGYLLVYHVHNLKTLFLLFPKLRVIRGYDLYRNLYSLVVYENLDLEALGLANLKRIQHGMLRIIANPELCYIDTVNWRPILANYTTQTMRMWRNKWQRMCPLCSKNQTFCWDSLHAQLSYKASDQDCLEFDNKSGVCSLCANLLSDGGCVEDCKHPESLRLQRRRCVTVKQCTDIGRFVLEGDCLAHCPPERVFSRHEQHTCGRQCLGDYVIRNSGDLEQLKGCANTLGSLVINLGHDNDPELLPGLHQALSHVQVIVNYLKIVNSRQLVSIDFLPNLIFIEGREQLCEGKYTLYIANNPYLERITNKFANLLRINAEFFIQWNPRLCVDQIASYVGKFRLPPTHPARFTNSDRLKCERMQLTLKVVKRSATALKLEREILDPQLVQYHLSFFYYYKEAPVPNRTGDDAYILHGCGYDSWQLMVQQRSMSKFVVIEQLKPNTQYAIYLYVLVHTGTGMLYELTTNVTYARTLPTRAKPVQKIYTGYTNATQIQLHWWPPLNEQIGHYIIQHKLKEEDRPTLDYLHFVLLNKTTESERYNVEELCNCVPLKGQGLKFYKDLWVNAEHEESDYSQRILETLFEPTAQSRFRVVKVRGSIDLPKQRVLDPTASIPTGSLKRQQPQQKAAVLTAVQRAVWNSQNIDDTKFPTMPLPTCKGSKSTSGVKCTPKEHYKGKIVPGDADSIMFNGLRPDTSYVFTIRACTLGIENGCSVPVTHTARTHRIRTGSRIRGQTAQS